MSRSRQQDVADDFEDLPWDKYTFRVPRRLQGPNPSGTLRKRYFTQTVASFDAASAPASTKFNAFLSRFNHDSLATEINGSFNRLFDTSQGGFDTPIRILFVIGITMG